MKIIACILVSLALSSANAAGMPVDYEINGENYQGYYVSASADAPLVLLIHDWAGLTDYEVERAEMIAEMGYSVFAADLFGTDIRPTSVADKRQYTDELYKDHDKMRALLTGALEKAASLGGDTDNAVAMGYGFGGAAVLELARAGTDLKGFATFYGVLKTPAKQDYSKTKGEVLVMHGSADTAITMDQFAGLANDLEKADVVHEMVTYSGASHAFSVFNTERYHEDADRKSWERFSQFLEQVVDLPIESVVVPAESGVDTALEPIAEPVIDSGSENVPHAAE